MAGPSGESRSGSSLSLTLWRVVADSNAAPNRNPRFSVDANADPNAGDSSRAPRHRRRTRGAGEGSRSDSIGGARVGVEAGAEAGAGARGGVAARGLIELHFVALEGGSVLVPAPRPGLDRAPPGTVPALLPLFFPGLRAVAPPVQVNEAGGGRGGRWGGGGRQAGEEGRGEGGRRGEGSGAGGGGVS